MLFTFVLIVSSGECKDESTPSPSALHHAAGMGDPALIVSLIQKGSDVNGRIGSERETPLHRAVDAAVVRLLIKAGADPNAKSRRGVTPLMATLQRGHCAAAMELMRHGPKLDARDKYGMTMLHSAASGGCTEIGRKLLAIGQNINKRDLYTGNTALYFALVQGNIPFVELLLQSGAELDIRYRNEKDMTLVHAAASGGVVDAVRKLILSGAQVNPEDDRGNTPLSEALKNGHADVAKLLVTKGAKLDLAYRTSFKMTLLHCAAFGGCVDIARDLLTKGAKPDVTANYGNTPLHGAALFGRIDMVKLLLSRGADIRSKDDTGSTVLHHVLLFYTRPHLAERHRTLTLLLQKGADIDAAAAGYKGETALHMAVDRGFDDIVRTLIDAGCDLQITNAAGKTALDIANTRADKTIAELLQRGGTEQKDGKE